MMKSHFNDVIVGNRELLASFDAKGKLLRLFFPHRDLDILSGFETEVIIQEKTVNPDFFEYAQQYSNPGVIETTMQDKNHGVRIVQLNWVMPNNNILFFNYTIHSEIAILLELFFEFDTTICCNCCEKYVVNVIGSEEVAIYQYKQDKVSNYKCTITIPQGDSTCWVAVCFSRSRQELDEIKEILKKSPEILLQETVTYWRNKTATAEKFFGCLHQKLRGLLEKTVFLFHLLQDKSGAIIAAVENDEQWQKCGQYGYCWPRDGFYVAKAMIKMGLYDEVKKFIRWLFSVQESNGSWKQRYSPSGQRDPRCWGFQVDQVGGSITALWEYFEVKKDLNLLKELWSGVRKAADFIYSNLDTRSKLVLPEDNDSLWENGKSHHGYTYSSAICWVGLQAAEKIARQIGETPPFAWLVGSKSLKRGIKQTFHREKIRLTRRPFDETVDLSLLGVIYPAEMIEPSDPCTKATVYAVEHYLSTPNGGICRFEGDDYIGYQNAWILGSFWLAICFCRIGDHESALRHFWWGVNHATKHGFLPEQVSGTSAEVKVAWVSQLGWSHAMFILALEEFLRAGVVLV